MSDDEMTWISVNDRMPKPDDFVLMCTPSARLKVWIGHYNEEDGWVWDTGVRCNRTAVTHWMPIPLPPETS